MGDYKITIEYIERNEYEIKIDGEGFPCAGDIYDHYEDDPKYLVREIIKDDDGTPMWDECLDTFETYQEALDYVKEVKEKKK